MDSFFFFLKNHTRILFIKIQLLDTAVNSEAYSKNYARKIIFAVFGKSENEKKAPMKQRHT